MDISKIDAAVARENEPVTVPLNGPDGKPDTASDGTRATLSMVGVYSSHYRDAERAWYADCREKEIEPTADALRIEIPTWSIVGWHGIESAGTALECTPENIRTVLTKAPWIFDQARIALNGRDKFFHRRLGRLIAHVRHEAQLDVRGSDGFSLRQHLSVAAKRGKAEAVKALKGPPCPESLRYLLRWARELHGRSGVTQFGFVPVTYSTIESWARLMNRVVTPADVEAIVALDSVMLAPGEAKP